MAGLPAVPATEVSVLAGLLCLFITDLHVVLKILNVVIEVFFEHEPILSDEVLNCVLASRGHFFFR